MWDWTSSTATQIIKRTVAQIIMHPQYNSATVSHLLLSIAVFSISSFALFLFHVHSTVIIPLHRPCRLITTSPSFASRHLWTSTCLESCPYASHLPRTILKTKTELSLVGELWSMVRHCHLASTCAIYIHMQHIAPFCVPTFELTSYFQQVVASRIRITKSQCPSKQTVYALILMEASS